MIKLISDYNQQLHTLVLLLISIVTIFIPEQVRYIGFLILIYTVILVVDMLYNNYIKHKKHKFKLQKVLKECVHTVEDIQGRNGKDTLRANIMLVNKGKLTIVTSYRMEFADDKDIKLEPGQGCAGHAYESKKEVIGNLDEAYEETWEKTIANSKHTIWGIKREHYEKTKGLKSLLSIPIFDNFEEDKVIGAFNLDDKVSINESLFKDEKVLSVVKAYVFIATMGGE